MKLTVLALAILATGCATQPPYSAPSPIMAENAQIKAKVLGHLAPWEKEDEVLASLILQAQTHSPTLASALAKIKQARGLQGQSDAKLMPSVDFTASQTRSGDKNTEVLQTLRKENLSVSWEVDVFQKNQSDAAAKSAKVTGKEYDWEDARVLLTADVVDAYSSAIQSQKDLVLAEDDLASRQKTLKLTEIKYNAGVLAAPELARIQASVSEAKMVLTIKQTTAEVAFNKLAWLTDLPKSTLKEKLEGRPLQMFEFLQPKPLAAESIRMRPDIKSAEMAVQAAYADLGYAKASRLPSFSLSGALGQSVISSAGGSSLLAPWSFALAMAAPLFDGGAGAGRVTAAEGAYEDAIAGYQAKVRLAAKEVEDALAKLQNYQARQAHAQNSKLKYQAYYDSVAAKYAAGTASLLELEDARRSLNAAKSAELAAVGDAITAQTLLFKAVGGAPLDTENNTKE